MITMAVTCKSQKRVEDALSQDSRSACAGSKERSRTIERSWHSRIRSRSQKLAVFDVLTFLEWWWSFSKCPLWSDIAAWQLLEALQGQQERGSCQSGVTLTAMQHRTGKNLLSTLRSCDVHTRYLALCSATHLAAAANGSSQNRSLHGLAWGENTPPKQRWPRKCPINIYSVGQGLGSFKVRGTNMSYPYTPELDLALALKFPGFS